MTSEASKMVATEQTTFVDIGMALYERLTGRGAAINYEFKDMVVQVPRETGENAPFAVWKLNGTVRITTDETSG
ncbi:MAG: hypothetical protein AAF708_04680 [Deinococcota bacterium]